MPGLFHDASGKVAHEVRHVYIHACLHALEAAWGRGFVAHDLGVPARTLVRLPEVATRWVRSLHLIPEAMDSLVPSGKYIASAFRV